MIRLFAAWRRVRSFAAVALLSLVSASGALAQYDLVAPRGYPSGGSVATFALADVDEDGRLDVIVPGGSGLLFHPVRGPFDRWAPPAEWAVTGVVTALSARDFDGDGHADVAVAASSGGLSRLDVLFGDGRGAFASPVVVLTTSSTLGAFEAFDANADGLADFAIGSAPPGIVSIVVQIASGRAFAPPVDAAIGGDGIHLATGDFNGDGSQDVVAAIDDPRVVYLVDGDGAGGFTNVRSFPSYVSPASIASADLDQDGLTDVVLTGYQLRVLRGDALLGLTPAWTQRGGVSSYVVTTGDVDSDGILDLLTSGFLLAWRKGDGLGGFGEINSIPGNRDDGPIALTDVDGDGIDDIAVMGKGRLVVDVFLGLGSGAFMLPRFLTNPSSGHAAAVDANADGTVDIVMAGNSGLSIYFGDGAGDIFSTGTALLPNSPSHVSAGELIGGGDVDLAVVSTSRDTVTLLRGGGGGFINVGEFPTGADPVASAVGDFDGDGWGDIGIATGGSTVSTLLYGNGAGDFVGSPSPERSFQRWIESADFDADGVDDLAVSYVEPSALAILFGAAGRAFTTVLLPPVGSSPGGIALGDADRDGAIDVILGDEVDSSFRVFFGDGARAFPRNGTFATPAPAHRVSIADATGDGFVDVLVAHGAAGLFSVHAGDGRGGFGPATTFHSMGEATQVLPLDLGEDGSTEIFVPSRPTSPAIYRLRETILTAAMRGTVDAGRGPARDVMFVNGVSGGFSRVVRLRPSDPFDVFVARPPAEISVAEYAAYAWTSVPSRSTVRALPAGLGSISMPMPLSPGTPAPREIWNNIGRYGKLGAPTRPSSPAPTFLVQLPAGVGRAVTFTLQGIIVDAGAPNGIAAVTNGIVVEVE